jgi:Fe-S-cluster containining protein
MIKKDTPVERVVRLGDCRLGAACAKCNQGCKQGSGCFTHEQIPKAAQFLKLNEENFKKIWLEPMTRFNTTLFRPKLKRKQGKHEGLCVFFDEKEGCMIHEVKPMECRISNHNEYGEALHLWFTLNYFVNPNDPQSVREWANHIESGGVTIPGGSLNELVPNQKTLKKIMEYKILK